MIADKKQLTVDYILLLADFKLLATDYYTVEYYLVTYDYGHYRPPKTISVVRLMYSFLGGNHSQSDRERMIMCSQCEEGISQSVGRTLLSLQ